MYPSIGSVVSVSVLAVGVPAPGLQVRAGAAVAGQGHGYAHEECPVHHHSLPSICPPKDDRKLFCVVLCLVHDSLFTAVSYTPSQNPSHTN